MNADWRKVKCGGGKEEKSLERHLVDLDGYIVSVSSCTLVSSL